VHSRRRPRPLCARRPGLASAALTAGWVLVATGSNARADAPPAAAETPAKTAYRQGVEFFKQKKFADAIREFNKAYRLDPNPVLVFNMARAFEELQQYDSAIEYYRKYLEMLPDAPDRKTVEESIRTLEILQKQAATPVLVPLTVTSKPDGARVFVDGREIGTTPLKTTVPAGHHYLAVEADGHERHASEFDATAEAPFEREIVLLARAATVAPAGQDAGLSRRTWAFITMGTGGAVGALGGVSGLLASRKADKLDEIDADPRKASESQYEDLKSEGKNYALAADVLMGVGAAGVVAGLVLLFTGDDPAATAAPATDAPPSPAAGWSF
jgi:tetratricopeptide (TPR) repeat protein